LLDAQIKTWSEIGYKMLLDKIRQALRKGAPELLKEMNLNPNTAKGSKGTKANLKVPDNIVSVTPEPDNIDT